MAQSGGKGGKSYGPTYGTSLDVYTPMLLVGTVKFTDALSCVLSTNGPLSCDAGITPFTSIAG